jgi:UDP-N-acetylglucosamine 2-epimerase
MQCTSPFTTAEHVIECIKAHRLEARQTTFSVVQLDAHLVPSGQVYVFNRGIVDRDTEFFTMTPAATKIITNQALAIDVDTKEDFDRAVALLAEQKKPTAVIAKGKGALQVVSLHCYSTDRADRGHLYPLYEAAAKDKRFKAVFTETDHEEWPIHRQDVVFLQGDRTELLEVAAQAIREGCIIAHAAGGERTKGSTDDCTRDAITKLAHLHYPVHLTAGERIMDELGEEGWRICVAGEIGVDDIKSKPLKTPDELMSDWPHVFTQCPPQQGDVVVAVHPVTSRPLETEAVLLAVRCMVMGSWRRAFFSTPNGDKGREEIIRAFDQLAMSAPLRYGWLPDQMGALAFRSLMKACGTIIGNSSSLITEAPHLGVLPILIGTRQEGRFPSESDGNACGRILDHLYAAVTQRGDAIRTKA